ncbi:hypothetical protein ACH5AO_14080 [Streptomyces sp. NPDC018964]|uniref:hypothetical protein n=1 Tax=unclassified Streptomyces TaxID=2593676 RepID=UPI00378A6EE2
MKCAYAARAGLTAVAVLTVLTVGGCRAEDAGLPAVSPSGRVSGSASSTPPAERSGPRTLVDAPAAGGLDKLTGEGALTDVPVDPGEMRDGMTLVTGNYGDPDGRGGAPVLFEGVDHVPEDTHERREHLFRGMLEHIRWDPELGTPEARPVEPGPLGGSVECLLASLSEDGNVICGWADEGTAAVALFEDSTPAAAGELFVEMRGDLER